MTQEVWKYFSRKEGDSWIGRDLLSLTQVWALLNALEWKKETFASVQDYDADGNIVACPLYFDIDSADPAVSLSAARDVVAGCEFLINVTPRIYFSGSKGFHLIIERKIIHPRCHELAGHFAAEGFSHVSAIDRKVYRTRSMFRIPGSPASKPGYYKIELTRTELFTLMYDDIKTLARSQRSLAGQHDPEKIDESVFQAWLAQALRELPEYKDLTDLATKNHSVASEITPCIKTMLTTPAESGDRHNTVYILSRFFKGCGVDEVLCQKLLLEQPHHRAYEETERGVLKIIRSVYSSPRAQVVGCRGQSTGAALMRRKCAPPCHFRADFDHSPFAEEQRVPEPHVGVFE